MKELVMLQADVKSSYEFCVGSIVLSFYIVYYAISFNVVFLLIIEIYSHSFHFEVSWFHRNKCSYSCLKWEKNQGFNWEINKVKLQTLDHVCAVKVSLTCLSLASISHICYRFGDQFKFNFSGCVESFELNPNLCPLIKENGTGWNIGRLWKWYR